MPQYEDPANIGYEDESNLGTSPQSQPMAPGGVLSTVANVLRAIVGPSEFDAVKDLGTGAAGSITNTLRGAAKLGGFKPEDNPQSQGPMGNRAPAPQPFEPQGWAQKAGFYGADLAPYIAAGGIRTAPTSLVGRILRSAGEVGAIQSAQSGRLRPDAALTAGAITGVTGLAGKAVRKLLGYGADQLTGSALNPIQQEAVDYAEKSGIPLDEATRTGNPILKGLKASTQNTLGGATAAAQAKLETEKALQQHGRDLVADIGGDVRASDKAGAGQRIISQVRGAFNSMKEAANDAYGQWRELIGSAGPQQVITAIKESRVYDPAAISADGTLGDFVTQQVPKVKEMIAPVNIAQYKQMAKGMVDALGDELPQAQGRIAEAISALKKISTMDDVVPLDELNNEVSALGYIRFANKAGLTTQRKDAILTNLWAPLRDVVNQATEQHGGQEAIGALNQGRVAVANYFRIEKYAQKLAGRDLAGEGANVFRSLVKNEDGGIQALQRLQEIAPNAIPNAARGTLQSILTEAQEEGGFKAAKALGTWNNLGSRTKQLLFGDKAGDISNFLQAAKLASEDANPSGSAKVGALVAQGIMIAKSPLTATAHIITNKKIADMIYTPGGAKLLADAINTPVSSPTARAIATKLFISKVIPKLQFEPPGSNP